jgi:hypothetical protein
MTVLEKLNSIIPGWTTYPDGTIYTNPNQGGGIIDVSWGTNKWFVIFMDFDEVSEDIETLDEAVEIYMNKMVDIPSESV